jgi:hypothetical protein
MQFSLLVCFEINENPKCVVSIVRLRTADLGYTEPVKVLETICVLSKQPYLRHTPRHVFR